MLIPQKIFGISKLCDTDGGGRYVLGAVRLERDADGPVAVACDSLRMIAVRWQEDKAEEYPAGVGDMAHVADFSTLIPQKQWQELGKLPPKKSLKSILCNAVVIEPTANGRLTVGATDLETHRTLSVKVPEGRYINWRNAIPTRKPWQETHVCVDAKLLSDTLATIAPLTGWDHSCVTLCVPLDPTTPLTVLADDRQGVKSTAVVMPLCAGTTSEVEAARKITKRQTEEIYEAIAYRPDAVASAALGMLSAAAAQD